MLIIDSEDWKNKIVKQRKINFLSNRKPSKIQKLKLPFQRKFNSGQLGELKQSKVVNFVRMVALTDGLPKMALLHLLLLSSLLPTAFSLLAEGPKDLLVASGSPASLSCRSTSPQSASVTWLRSGAPLPPSPTSLLLPEGELFLLTTKEDDSGSYSCIVTDSDGVFHSPPATLTVIDKEEDEGSLDSSASEDGGKTLVIQETTEEVDKNEELPKTEEELEIEEAILAYESSEDYTSLTAPVVTMATISNPGTGIVQWASVPAATSYIVRVFAADWEVTNITVESGVDTVRLHNLADNIRYSVMVASRGEDGTSSPFSPPSPLLQSTSLPSSSASSNTLPSSLWITAISILVVLTILTIIGAALILTRLRGFQKVATNPESPATNSLWGTKRLSWVDPRWGSSRQQAPESSPSNQQAALLSADTTYMYASSSNSSRGEESNHYAYVDLVRDQGLHSFR